MYHNWTVTHCFIIYLASKLNLYIYHPLSYIGKIKEKTFPFLLKYQCIGFESDVFLSEDHSVFFPKIHEKLQSIFTLFWDHTDDGKLCLFWCNPVDCFPDVLETWPIGEETKQHFISIMCKTLPIIFPYNPHQ